MSTTINNVLNTIISKVDTGKEGNNNGKIDIDRVFNPKYPYEYLSQNHSGQINKAIIDYYNEKGLL